MFFLTAVFLFVVFLLIKKRKKIPWIVPPVVLFTAFCSLSLSDPGAWLAGHLGGFVAWMGSWFGVPGVIAISAVLVVLVLAAGLDLMDKKADRIAIAALVLVPMLALSAGGPVAQAVNEIRGGVAEVGTTGVGGLLG